MNLDDLLDPQHVDLGLTAQTKSEAIRTLVNLLAASGEIREPEVFLKDVLAREEASSTLAENGIAFPHARTDAVSKVAVAIGRSDEGVPFGENGEPADLIFLIAVPRRLVNDYLVCVGALARILKDEARRVELLRAPTAEKFISQLQRVEPA